MPHHAFSTQIKHLAHMNAIHPAPARKALSCASPTLVAQQQRHIPLVHTPQSAMRITGLLEPHSHRVLHSRSADAQRHTTTRHPLHHKPPAPLHPSKACRTPCPSETAGMCPKMLLHAPLQVLGGRQCQTFPATWQLLCALPAAGCMCHSGTAAGRQQQQS